MGKIIKYKYDMLEPMPGSSSESGWIDDYNALAHLYNGALDDLDNAALETERLQAEILMEIQDVRRVFYLWRYDFTYLLDAFYVVAEDEGDAFEFMMNYVMRQYVDGDMKEAHDEVEQAGITCVIVAAPGETFATGIAGKLVYDVGDRP